MSRPRVLLIDRGGLIALAALIAYVAIAPTWIVDGDGAEFATLGTAGGVAHPTGYPAYLLWLRATAWLPGATPAHTTAIATAILAAIQIAVLHAACRAWGARSSAATLAVAIYAAGPVVLRYSSQTEVFALNQLVVAAVVWLAAAHGPVRGVARVAALGLAAGIGLADHLTCALIAPVGLLGAIRGVREAERPVAAAAAGVAALVGGLAPYAYLFVTDENAVSWSTFHTAGELIDHVLRRAYGGPAAFSPRPQAIDVAANLGALAATVARGWCWIPGLAGLAMLGVRSARRAAAPSAEPRAEPRIGWAMLALALVIAGPALAARFDSAQTGSLHLYVVRRFHLIPTLLLAPAVAQAFDALIARYEARLRPGAVAAIAVLGFATAALVALPDLLRVRTPAVERAMRGLLRGLPRDAVVLGSGDIQYFGTGYLQIARGERPDVTYVYWQSVAIRWYRDRLARRGIVIDTAARGTPSLRVAEQLLAAGRPLFVDLTLGNILRAFPSYPHGALFRVLPRGQAAPSLDEVAALNRDWFAALDLDYPHPGADDEYPALIHELYAEPWRVLAERFAAAGQTDAAAEAQKRAQELAPGQ